MMSYCPLPKGERQGIGSVLNKGKLNWKADILCRLALADGHIAIIPAFDTPTHIIADFKIIFWSTQAAAFGWLNPSAIGGKRF